MKSKTNPSSPGETAETIDADKLVSELKERNVFIETILKNIPIGVAVNRIDSEKLTLMNKQFSEAYGWDENDFEDVKSFFSKVYPDESYRQEIAGKVMADIDSRDITRMQWNGISVTTKSGGQRIVNARNIPIYSQNLMISTVCDVTEEVRKTEEIKRIKTSQEALINGNNDFIWSVDRDMRLITQNKRYIQFVELLNGKAIAEGDDALFEGLGPKGIADWREYYKRGLAGERFTTKTSAYDEINGIWRYGLVSINPMYNAENEVFGVSCYVKDVTDETLNLIELQRTKSELEKIMQSSQDMIISLKADNIILSISIACETILGYKQEELINKPLFNFIHPDDKERSMRTAAAVMDGIAVNNFENRYIRKDGSVVYLSWSAKWDDKGEIRYGIARDITEKKKSENALLESEKKYRRLFEYNPLPLFFWDLETFRFIDCNEAAVAKYGYTKEEFLRLRTKDVWAPGFSPDDQNNDGSGKPAGIYKRNRRHVKKNGEVIDVEVSGQIMDYGGKKVSLAMVNDITETQYYYKLDMLEKHVLEMNATNGSNLFDLLKTYLSGIEVLHPGMQCSICERKQESLHNIAAPSLPIAYLEEIKTIPIRNNSGSCGTAAFLKKDVFVQNIQEDAIWQDFKEIAERYQLKACWSHPIMDSNEQVIATFACYYKEVKLPTEFEKNTINRAVNIIKLILEQFQREKALKISNERFEYATEATSDIIWDWDLETNAVYYSGNINKLFGHDSGVNFNNLPFYFEQVHPEDRERVILYPERVKYGEMNHWTAEYRFKKANGEYAEVLDKALVIRDENGLGRRMVGAMQDITRKKQEERRLKLLESVITNTNDSVMITEAEPFDEPSPRILYVNEAFTKMTGYTPGEVIGKSPRFLQGSKTDKQELSRMKKSMQNWQPCDITVINYKKNGEEFWINISIVPVADEKGWYTHWVAIEKDVTQKKNEELQKELLASISKVFNENIVLKESLKKTLKKLLDAGNFSLAEFWLIDNYSKKIKIEAQYYKNEKFSAFANSTLKIEGLSEGEGFPGITWKTGKVQYWNYKKESNVVRRFKETIDTGFKRAYSLPLFYNDEIIGTLALLLENDELPNLGLATVFEDFSKKLGAEIKRKQLEEELNQIFLFTPDILCIASTDGYFTKVNPSMSAILEYSEQELLNSPFMNLVHPADKEKTAAELKNIIDGNPTYYIENRYITKSGKIKWLAWTTTSASDKGTMFCSAKDISEKKEVEQMLNKANSLARIGGWDVDLRNNIIHWSDMTREIHEVEPGTKLDIETAANFYLEGIDRETIVKAMTEAAQTGKAADLELRIVTAKGNIKWVRVIVEAEFEDGLCSRLYGSFQDIDKRKTAESAANDALQERNTILESIGDGFFALNKSWEITYWNKVAGKVLGKPRASVINKKLWEVFNDSIATEVYNKYYEALETKRATHFEMYYDEKSSWFEISAYPSTSGLAVYFKDITDRKKADKQFLELNENLKVQANELLKSNAELEQFAYVASHDLQEPLRMVTGFLTQLENKYGEAIDDKGKQYIHFAVDGAKRMRQIIFDLLEFSRIGRVNDEVDTVNVNKLVKEVLILCKGQVEEKNAVVNFENLPTIETFKTPLRQVLQNLISNGLKYQRPGVSPIIDVLCTETERNWEFEVKDNGLGIEKEYFDKVFVLFQRLHSREEYSGTGIGLAIAKKIIENMGGKIWIASELGKGTSFYFTIPKKIEV